MFSRSASIALGVLLLASTSLHARPLPSVPHVRAVDKVAREAIALAIKKSPTVRDLIDELSATDVVAYVECPWESGTTGHAYMSYLTAAGGFRYVVVHLPALSMPDQRIEWLGHELHHALEVADAPWVQGQEDMAVYYSQIGWRHAFREHYETSGAQDVSARVRKDLTGGNRPR